MINNKLKAVIAALTIVSGGLVQGANTKVASCCTASATSGNAIIVSTGSGTACDCTIDQSGAQTANPSLDLTIPPIPIAARGDVVKLDLQGMTAMTLNTTANATGTIHIPQVGSMNLYQYGDIRIVIGSFSLVDLSQNPQNLPASLKMIIRNAAGIANKSKWPKSMIWVARALPGETIFTEVMESYTASNLASAEPIQYRALNNKSVQFTIPATQNKQSYSIIVNSNPIKK